MEEKPLELEAKSEVAEAEEEAEEAASPRGTSSMGRPEEEAETLFSLLSSSSVASLPSDSDRASLTTLP